MIQLTTPFSVGSFDDQDYTHVKIISFRHDAEQQVVVMEVWKGFLDQGAFVVGKQAAHLNPQEHIIRNLPEEVDGEGDPIPGSDDPQYTTATSAVASAAGVLLYDEVAEVLYQWLLDNVPEYAGTIV